MLDRLALWGLPQTQAVRTALPDVPPRHAWPRSLHLVEPRLGPVIDRESRHVEPSVRLSVLLADLLELGAGLRVVLPSTGFVFLRALVGATGAKVLTGPHDVTADRILRIEPQAPQPFVLAPDGFTLRLDVRPGQETLEKVLAPSAQETKMGLLGIRLAPGRAPPEPRLIRHLLDLEGLQIRALGRAPVTRRDRHFADAVKTTWDPPAANDPLDEAERRRLEDARDFFHLGYIEQFEGDLPEAIDCYRASTMLFPTSEAHTFLGWAFHFAGRTDLAIEECRRAIMVDPAFGNPYNDIGAYLLELGKPREALEWLVQAQGAPRYATPHYAHCNAGRAYMMMGRPSEARHEFHRALQIAPGYAPAAEGLRKLSTGD